MLQGEHSAILLTFIKLPFVIKIFVLSNFEWPLYTGFTVPTKSADYGLIRPVHFIFISKLIDGPLNDVNLVTGMLQLTRENKNVLVSMENEQFIFL